MDTSDLSLGEPQEPIPTLYGFLVDLFGESLILRLIVYLQSVSQREKKAERKADTHAEPTPPSQKKVAPKEDMLLDFLKREGFKPYKVQLPHKPLPHKPPAFHPWGRKLWRFYIPTTLLPVQRNALDAKSKRKKRSLRTTPPNISRGRLHRCRGRRPPLIDFGSVWL